MGELKPGWSKWRFDQMAMSVTDRVDDPSEAGVEHYVGLEHLDSDSLKIPRWGSPEDVSATKLVFQPGDIIFGRRRAYQRKLGVAEFHGIASAHSLVLRAKPEVVLPDFLPFFMQSDLFMELAQQISVGSLSPTINWKTLAKQEFALPPLEEQRRIAAVAARWFAVVQEARGAVDAAYRLRDSMRLELTKSATDWTTVEQCIAFLTSGSRGWSKHYAESGDLFLRIGNLNSPTLRLNLCPEQLQCVHTPAGAEAKRTRAQEGDVLLGITGEAGLGLVGHAPDLPLPAYISQHIAMIRPNPALCHGRFLAHVLASPFGQQQVARFNQPGAKSGMTLIDVRRLPIPELALQEQVESAQRIDEVESAILSLEKHVARSHESASEQVRHALAPGRIG